MSNSWKSVDVQCPFYRADNSSSVIRCEGPGEATSISTLFAKHQSWETHISRACCGEYHACPMYRMILEKYTA